MANYYEVLGVEKGATQDEIKKAYRKKAIEHHPDKGGSEEKFREATEAYDILSDEQKRGEYDAYGSVGGGNRYQGHGFNMDDIFSQFGDIFGGNPFRQQQQRVRRGSDLRVQLNVTLEDVIGGSTKKVKYKRKIHCKPCFGKGGTDVKNCIACNGSGQRIMSQQTPFGNIQTAVPCNNCQATGKIISNKCKSCHGEGVVDNEDIVEVNLPRGVAGGMQFEMSGLGNFARDGVAGNLQVFINEIRHNKFSREGADLHCEEWITIPEAVLGRKMSIPTLQGDVNITIDAGCESGRVFTITGKGVPRLSNNGQVGPSGNLHIKVNVRIPKDISMKEKQLYQELQNL
jgi:molecular chaperone DnaJ